MHEPGITLAMPVYRDLPRKTAVCLLQTQQAIISANIPYTIDLLGHCSVVHYARNQLARNFMTRQHSVLFFIDSDTTWKVDDFMKFVAMSRFMPVLCAQATLKKDPPEISISFLSDCTPNDHGCISIAGCGLCFTAINRDIMAQLAERAPARKFFGIGEVPYIFRGDEATDSGDAQGEDAAFFNDVRNNGHGVYFDPSVILGHIGEKEYKRDA